MNPSYNTIIEIPKPLNSLGMSLSEMYKDSCSDSRVYPMRNFSLNHYINNLPNEMSVFENDYAIILDHVQDYDKRLSSIKKEMEERDAKLNDFNSKQKAYDSLQTKEKDKEKAQSIQEKYEASKNAFFTINEKIINDLSEIVNNAPNELDEIYFLIFKTHRNLFGNLASLFNTNESQGENTSITRTRSGSLKESKSKSKKKKEKAKKHKGDKEQPLPPLPDRSSSQEFSQNALPPLPDRHSSKDLPSIPPSDTYHLQTSNSTGNMYIPNSPSQRKMEILPPPPNLKAPDESEKFAEDKSSHIESFSETVNNWDPFGNKNEEKKAIPPPIKKDIVIEDKPKPEFSEKLIIPEDEQKKYCLIFKREDPDNVGYIDGQKALKLFTRSTLDTETLSDIWDLADQDVDGKLTKSEFVIAMWLINSKLRGTIKTIPTELHPSLILSNYPDRSLPFSFK